MKRFLPLLLVIGLSADCEAQYSSPLTIAYDLYRGCIDATIDNGRYPEKKSEVQDYIHSMDVNCINWTASWLPVLIDRNGDSLTKEELKLLEARREALLEELTKAIMSRAK